jgi:ferritin-like metal-binding protein YciE
MSLATPRDLFIHDLSDMLSAENIIRGMLGEVIKETKVPDHKKAFQEHLKETEGHIKNLQAVFKSIGEQPEPIVCHGAEGLKKEHDSLKEEKPTGHVLEMGLLGGASKTEHYEIASYTDLVQMAKDLGEPEAAKLLKENLDQEKAMSKTLETLSKAVGKDYKAMTKATTASNGRATSASGSKAKATSKKS